MRAEIVRTCPRCGEATGGARCARCRVPAAWTSIVDLDQPLDDGRSRIHREYPSRAEAEIALRRLLDEHDTGHPPQRPEITLGEYLAEVWLPMVRRHVVEAAWRSYHDELHRHVIGRIGDEALGSFLMRRRIERLFETLATDGRLDGQGGLSPRTVRYIYNLLRRALDDAVTWGFTDHNPALGVLPRRPAPTRGRRPRGIWNPGQLERFRRHARDHRLAAAWLLVADAGLRRGELLGLAWRDLDLDAGRLRVCLVYVTVNGDAQLVPPRSRHARRSIDLDPDTVGTLAVWRDRQRAERTEAADAWEDHGLVVTQPNGRPIDPDNFTKIFARLVRRARLPHASLGDLRMMHAVRLLDDGVDPDDVARRLGVHSGYYLRRACLTYLAEAHLPEAAPHSRSSMEGAVR